MAHQRGNTESRGRSFRTLNFPSLPTTSRQPWILSSFQSRFTHVNSASQARCRAGSRKDIPSACRSVRKAMSDHCTRAFPRPRPRHEAPRRCLDPLTRRRTFRLIELPRFPQRHLLLTTSSSPTADGFRFGIVDFIMATWSVVCCSARRLHCFDRPRSGAEQCLCC
jgi:hypothetical protein